MTALIHLRIAAGPLCPVHIRIDPGSALHLVPERVRRWMQFLLAEPVEFTGWRVSRVALTVVGEKI